MIGRLTGRLDYRADDHILIDVRGVGYIVYVSDRTMMGLPGPGAPVSLYTDMMVREDLMQLFGFPNLVEKEWHRLLMSVQGVGAKASLAILGTLGADGVGRAIALGDWNAVRAAKGIGPKIAQRLVLDLKDKAPAVMAMGSTAGEVLGAPDEAVVDSADNPPARRAPAPSSRAAQADALSALSNLGYGLSEATAAVAEAAAADPDADAPALIRAALKLLAPA
ncbi:Holliday junction branch migration protein RuvA [Aestuariivita sp.]|jgi:Holliday junction DNA helicase RuvA|uniref:Holliday junction branch migration protein RuvA n=1 Tax=Aestuariivita sp. TaxID=1872407 RepID=UPI00216F2FE5|nr:Holliday junction branch migration protein RuvA [Aestuariivita sp.]MCE8005909.1 Holliday junction branch migration protein RuvA [Aestuariivita sp.]